MTKKIRGRSQMGGKMWKPSDEVFGNVDEGKRVTPPNSLGKKYRDWSWSEQSTI
jgi:hypothetical protein